ncbi:acetate/propionate family kinase [Pinisolibacter aquiterrae]|uniref:acetate/propionate family kinase n=1 Tax=Pinisolibacter aquiterrae TaxID=2815579 RepID=UPI001C3DBBFE|nr:acetate kinase [Pinisolibacter aquiterrae]MBV5262660.1 acetate kinase [Pinisolibacter aquiterrae]MCC8236014.1 acetate kinase [Pinisolibacter aquiterrae]
MSHSPRLVLVVNSGSSSLKFTVLPAGGGAAILSGVAECLGLAEARLIVKENGVKTIVDLVRGDHAEALATLFAHLDEDALLDRVAVIGHRVVHGGERFTESVLVTPRVIADIEAVSALAPLHNPAALIGLCACLEALPGVPQVAVFDTAFHQTMPRAAWTYALPQALYRDHGIRRYGFHGTSHRCVSARAVDLLGLDPDDHGIVVAHLGNGASATAVLDGRSVDTTMGLTPLEGLVMGTRSGDLDVGVVAHLARVGGRSLAEIETLLNKESGLLGLSGLSSDCRTLEAAADEGHPGAILALEVFVHRLARHIGGLATSLPRLDAVVFTGGIGENSSRIRAMTLARLAAFGFDLDETSNVTCVGGREGRISRGGPPVAVVVPTDEEGLIAADAARLAGIGGAEGMVVEEIADVPVRLAV